MNRRPAAVLANGPALVPVMVLLQNEASFHGQHIYAAVSDEQSS